MIKLIALYRRPDDEDAFWQHYEKVHLPLVRKLPGIAEVTLDRVTADAFGGEAAYYLVAQMSFPDQPTFDAAMRSDENRALGKDLMSFARGKVDVLITNG
ncbi:MAG TPA: EthD family reductase [Trueperaceae bacterium]|nr:EthD family reductase [Trueperaceae bacterium]